MPSPDQTLIGLREIANSWRAIAVAWHIYFGALALAFASGFRPSRKMEGVGYLHVALDWVLILGAVLMLVHTFSRRPQQGVLRWNRNRSL